MQPGHRPTRVQSTAEEIRRRIATGMYPPHASLPGERALAAELGVSRGTLGKALAQLADEGLLTQTQGRGTEVAPASTRLPRGAIGVLHLLPQVCIPDESLLILEGVKHALDRRSGRQLARATGA